MHTFILSTAITLLPCLAFADQQCVLPQAAAFAASPTVAQPQPYARSHEAQQTSSDHSPADSETSSAKQPGARGEPGSDLALARVRQAGADVAEIASSHGFRMAIARSDGQFMLMYLTGDGAAYVNGLMSELSPDDLSAMAPGQVTELGLSHGLRGLFVRNGRQFQVFYVSPDGQRVIPGSLIDADGKNVTKQQIASIPDVVPTVVIGGGPNQAPSGTGRPSSALQTLEGAHFGTIGSAAAPRLWMFIDPLCSWSVRAMDQLRPHVANGQVQLAVVPTAVLDHEDQGRSSVAAKAMLSLPVDMMVAAWGSRDLDIDLDPMAGQRLATNMAAAESIQLRGTPTFFWRKADGTEGRADGLPKDVDGLIASIGR